MFALHQRTRRRICQAGFGLICALPTSGLLAWTVTLKTANHALHRQQELALRLGMQVRFQSVRYPRPGQALYERFELLDAESGQCVARCRTLDVTRSGRRLMLAPSEIDVAAEHGEKLLRLLMRRLTRELSAEEAIWLVPSSLTLEAAAGGQTYDDVECLLESQADSETATLRFRLPEADAGEPPRLSLARRRAKDGAATTIKLETLSAALPIAVFSPWFDLRSVLGDHAAFRGTLILEDAGGQWSGKLAGLLTEVDLERLIARRFPHHFVGNGRVRIERSRFVSGKLLEAVGHISSDSGVVGGSLLAAAADLLGCQPGAAPAGRRPFRPGENYRYRDFGLVFQIGAEGLRLSASREAASPGAVVSNHRDEVMLYEPGPEPMPLVQLVRALAPESMLQVPATKESAALVPWLPLPSVVPPPQAASRVSAPPLRVGGE